MREAQGPVGVEPTGGERAEILSEKGRTSMNNTVRNEAQKFGIGAIVVAILVLVVFFFLSKSGLGTTGSAVDTTSGAPTTQSAGAVPSPAAT